MNDFQLSKPLKQQIVYKFCHYNIWAKLMYRTPIKNETMQSTPLRLQIQQKLSTYKKQNSVQKKKYKNYISDKKSLVKHSTSSIFSNKYQSDRKQVPKYKKLFQQKDPQQNQFDNVFNPNDSKYQHMISQKKIQQFQSLQNRGFYGFQQWIQFNQKYYSHVSQQTVSNFWKIIRILNYGQVLVPSGLIYLITICIFQKKHSIRNHYQTSISLKQVLNKFLRMNKVKDQISNFRQLIMYPSIESIESQYLQLSTKIEVQLPKRKSYSTCKLYETNSKIENKNEQNVFNRVYEDAKVRTVNKNQSIYKSLLQKIQDQNIKCVKKHSSKFPSHLFEDSIYKPQRICHDQQKWRTRVQDEQPLIFENTFKTCQFDKSMFQNNKLQYIPGVSTHIKRKQYSRAVKKQLQRYYQKPNLVFKHN